MSGLVDEIRQRRARALAAPKHLDATLPGFEGIMGVRYHPLPWEDFVELIERDTSDAEASLAGNIDTLLRATPTIIVWRDGSDKPITLAEDLREQGETVNTETGEVGFDHVLAGVLGVELGNPPDARDVVLAAFELAVSPPVKILDHAQAIGAWMEGTANAADERLGEESAATDDSGSRQPPTPAASTAQ